MLSEDAIAPFVRHDVYGELGENKLRTVDKLILYAQALILIPIRISSCLLLVVITWCFCKICRKFPDRFGSFLVGVGCRVLAKLIAMSAGLLSVSYKVAPGCERRTSIASRDAVPLLVCNHVSWMDIPLVSSLYTPSYVSKVRMKSCLRSLGPCSFVKST